MRSRYGRCWAEFGSPEGVLAAPHGACCKFVSAEIAAAIAETAVIRESIEPALAWLAEPDNFIVTLADADYPQLLLQTADPPALL